MMCAHCLHDCCLICSMEGGELFSRIQERADTAFTERGEPFFVSLSHEQSENLLQVVVDANAPVLLVLPIVLYFQSVVMQYC